MIATTPKIKALPKGRIVGRRRNSEPPADLAPHLRKFAAHLASLIGDDSVRVAESVGVSPDAVRKWCRGAMVPNLEHWPKLAAAVGLTDWRELLPPLKK